MFCQKVVSMISTFQLKGGGSSLPGTQLVRPTSPWRTLHWDVAAPLHPDARDGDGEVHDPHGHLQHPVRGLQPRLDHPPSYSPTSLYSPTSNTSSHVKLRSRNKLCTHGNLLHYMHLLKGPTSLSYFHLYKQNMRSFTKFACKYLIHIYVHWDLKRGAQ